MTDLNDPFLRNFLFEKTNRLFTSPGESVFEAARRFNIFDAGELKSKNKTLPLYKKLDEPVEVTVKGPVEQAPDDVIRISRIFDDLKYNIFRGDQKNYDLNIVGIRNEGAEPNAFDDEIWVFWRFENRWTLKKFKATTDPGLTYLEDPLNAAGTAILKEGQYKGAWRLGKHHGKYDALVQASPVTVIRDFNRDNKFDFASGKEQTGIFGINIHRSSATGESLFVNKWSAGCQVFARINEYNEFIGLVKKAIGEWGNSFTYSLINKRLMAG